ncbi:MAG: hydrogenase expression/formation protein HypE, partial [Gammaproteobacteria bacterium]|nr:hydrogenase expression/formation protein HypE [Gammaproteobacteria bacterium]
VNDVAMSGAKPFYLSVSFILEEGFALCDLECIVISMAQAAKDCAVNIVCGDTKVVERGKGDGVFISTTGVGVLPQDVNICGSKAQVGDIIILSGSIGDHGVAILSKRENLQFETTIESDSAALNHLVADMVNAVPQIHCLRDPTRGGLATTLNEIATQSAVGMHIHETAIPVKAEVAAACELLGLDPLYMANEGKLIAICARADAETLLCVMRDHPLAKHSSIIGEIVADKHRLVQMHTAFGGQRIVDYLNADPLPRIC